VIIDPDLQLLYPIDQALLALMILVIMFGMGASLTPGDFRIVLQRPRLMCVGFLSQFGFMPLIALGLAHQLGLSPALAIALILIGCLPGGTTSNMFAYFARGSVALSISMTTVSTLLALIMMPLLLALYTPGFTRTIETQLRAHAASGEIVFVIPTANIVVSLVLVLLPVGGGLVLRRVSRDWAKVAEDTGGFMGMIVICFLILTVLTRHMDLILQTPWPVYAAAIALGLIGFLFGYIVSRLFGAQPIYQRAISLETGIQNTPVAFAIILLSFPDVAIQNEMLWLAVIYSVFIVISSSLITLLLRRHGAFDWDVYTNTRVHARVFGPGYTTRYPPGFLPPRLANDPGQGSLPPKSPATKRQSRESPPH
jgi:bile acid transporter